MGPVMNLLLAVRAHRASCCIRAPRCRPTRISRWSSAWSPTDRRRRRPASSRAIASSRSAGTSRHLGRVLDRRSARGRTAKSRSACVRDGSEMTRTVTPTSAGQSRFEIGDIGVLPERPPASASRSRRAMPADKAGLKPGDVILAVERRADHVPARSCATRSRKHPEQPMHAVDRARRRASRRSP